MGLKEYPTLWSSPVWSGDILMLRQGFAIPVADTEWKYKACTWQKMLYYTMYGSVPKSVVTTLIDEWEKSRELNVYFMNKYNAELLGVAMWSAKGGSPVLVEVA
jgi:hypothetical protein